MIEAQHSMLLSPDAYKKIDRELAKFPADQKQSAVMAALAIAQDEQGWLSPEVIQDVAVYLEMPAIAVQEVATFYTMYNLKPVGKYVLEVCHTGPCMLRGSDDIIDYIKEKLGIGPGETTPDGLFTLKPAECLGACGYAPMMQLGKHYREHLTKEKIDQLIIELKTQANN